MPPRAGADSSSILAEKTGVLDGRQVRERVSVGVGARSERPHGRPYRPSAPMTDEGKYVVGDGGSGSCALPFHAPPLYFAQNSMDS